MTPSRRSRGRRITSSPPGPGSSRSFPAFLIHDGDVADDGAERLARGPLVPLAVPTGSPRKCKIKGFPTISTAYFVSETPRSSATVAVAFSGEWFLERLMVSSRLGEGANVGILQIEFAEPQGCSFGAPAARNCAEAQRCRRG